MEGVRWGGDGEVGLDKTMSDDSVVRGYFVFERTFKAVLIYTEDISSWHVRPVSCRQ